MFRGVAVISKIPKIQREGPYKKTTIINIEIKRKDNEECYLEFKDKVVPTKCQHNNDLPIKFCRHPDIETTKFMLQGLQKFVDNNLDFYEIIYSGVVPAVKYQTKNKPATMDDLSFAL